MVHDWKAKAAELEYETEKEMFEDLYSDMSLSEIAKALGCSLHTIRKKLVEHSVTIRSRGGPNGLKCTMNESVIEEMKVKGAAAVAQAQGISKYTLFRQKAKYLAEHPTSEGSTGQEPSLASPASSDPLEP